MKYIDSEKLIAEIERLKERAEHYFEISLTCGEKDYWSGESGALELLTSFITSLQQEQSMPDSTKLIELWHEDKEMLKEKDFRDDPWRLAYNAFMCGFSRGVAVKKQEQPSCKTCGFYENNCPFIRGKFIPYPNKVCKDYTYSVMKEQPEVDLDLDEEIQEHLKECLDVKFPTMDIELIKKDVAYTARKFYELGLNARKEE